MSATAARTQSSEGSHWYTKAGEACYEVPNKSKGGMRPTTLRDAKSLGLLPSVTTILRCLDKPALTSWLIEQAVLAVLTTPRKNGEEVDAFIQRVLHEEKHQEQEGQKARDRGTEIHAAMEALFAGGEIADDLKPWVMPAYKAICDEFKALEGTNRAESEIILVGNGYAGRLDLLLSSGTFWILDYKTTKRLPREPYAEHKMQLGAYAKALADREGCVPEMVGVANVYISTEEEGKFVILPHTEWWGAYEAFRNLVQVWQWVNDYKPEDA